jgi:hypothetical protein
MLKSIGEIKEGDKFAKITVGAHPEYNILRFYRSDDNKGPTFFMRTMTTLIPL